MNHWVLLHIARGMAARGFIVALIVLTLSGAGLNTVSAQPPAPPAFSPENNPLSTGTVSAPHAVPTAAAVGGSPAPTALTGALASDDRFNAAPTGWFIYTHQTITDVINTINKGNRLVDLSVEQFSPSYLFTATYVSESGAYAKAWWWYFGVDAATLSANLAANNARLISLKAYDIGGGQVRFAAVMISDTGADATGWWWYYGLTPADIVTDLNTNHARLTQVNAYQTNGQTRYAVVMVDNTGANNQAWWWYFNITPTDVVNNLNTNGARLVDLDRDPVTGNLNVIMVSCAGGCPLWWWYYGVSVDQVLPLAGQNGARIFDVNTYSGCGGTCYTVLMINDSNAVTSRVGQMLRSGTDGVKGLYLKQVGGPVLANLMDSESFEPASSLKVAVHLYGLQQVQNGSRAMSNLVNKYQPPASGSCPSSATVTGTETLQTADREMMWHSDNTRTLELTDTFGDSNINAMMSSIGMGSSSINHIFGCGGPTPNATSLDDLAKLYEGVANTTLLNNANRDLFYSQMAGKAEFQTEGYDWTGLWSTDIPNMINQEAPAGMPQALKDWFRNAMDLSYKAGNYKLCTSNGCATYVDDISIFGHATVPFCDAGGARQYVFGTYIYNSTSDATSGATFTATKAELLREQIHAGLASCYQATFLPGIQK